MKKVDIGGQSWFKASPGKNVSGSLLKKSNWRRIQNDNWDTDKDCVNSVNQGP
jgi:hypothetical protein